MDRSINGFIVVKIVEHLISLFSLEIWYPMSWTFECDECEGVINLIETCILLSNKPWFLVSDFLSFQQIQIVNCVCERYLIVPVSTEKPYFDAFVKEDLSEFFHGCFDCNLVIDVSTRSPSFIDLIDMIGRLVQVHVAIHSIIYVAVRDFRKCEFRSVL